jgi:hypothetical protein
MSETMPMFLQLTDARDNSVVHVNFSLVWKMVPAPAGYVIPLLGAGCETLEAGGTWLYTTHGDHVIVLEQIKEINDKIEGRLAHERYRGKVG